MSNVIEKFYWFKQKYQNGSTSEKTPILLSSDSSSYTMAASSSSSNCESLQNGSEKEEDVTLTSELSDGAGSRLSKPTNLNLTYLQEEHVDDLLGILSKTPEPFTENQDDSSLPFFHSTFLSGKYLEVKFNILMPDVYVRNSPVGLRLLAMEPVPVPLHIFNQYRMKLKIPVPTQKAREKRQDIRLKLELHSTHQDDSSCSSKNAANDLDSKRREVKYPRKALNRMDATASVELEQYLLNLMHHPLFRTHKDVLALFEISALSFIPGLGCKLKEGYVRKRSGGYAGSAGCCPVMCCSPCKAACGQYRERWLVLKETFIFFLSPLGLIRSVMLMDRDFQVSNGFRHTGIKNGIVMTSLSRRLVIMCDNDQSEKDWSTEIRRVQQEFAQDFCSRNNRHNSFVPVRPHSSALWYVDGSRYMWDVAEAIDAAQEEIFITDWWLSPDIYLKRPDLTAKHWLLSEVLLRAAQRGVFVYVLLYKEVEMALGLNSLYTKHKLDKMHPNIKVLRHPDHGGGGTLYWAHHEKLVIVDQQHAFVSGIDLCYGRWDDYRHRLVDLGHKGTQKGDSNAVLHDKQVWSEVNGKAVAFCDIRTSMPDLNDKEAFEFDVIAVSSDSTNDHEKCSSKIHASPALYNNTLNQVVDQTLQAPFLANSVDEQVESSQHALDHSRVLLSEPTSPDCNLIEDVLRDNVPYVGKRIGEDCVEDGNNSCSDQLTVPGSSLAASDLQEDAGVVKATTSDAVTHKFQGIYDVVNEIRKLKASHKSADKRSNFNYENSQNNIGKFGDSYVLTGSRRRLRSGSDPLRQYSIVSKQSSKLSNSGRSNRPWRVLRRQQSLDIVSQSSSKQSAGNDRNGVQNIRTDADYSSSEDGVVDDGIGDNKSKKSGVGAASFRATRSQRWNSVLSEMRHRGHEMKTWTRRKMNLNPLGRASSLDSELDFASKQASRSLTRKSAKKWRDRVLARKLGRQTSREKSDDSDFPSFHQHHAPTLYDSPSIHLWVGKDYVNWITKDLNCPDEPFSDSVDRLVTPRMPWHDIGLYVEGPAARDAARHFVQRWNAVKNEKVKNNRKYPYLLPRTYLRNPFSPLKFTLLNKHRVKCQVLRSVGEWSAAQHEPERSIYNAYLAAIRDSKHFLYIENQFFISSTQNHTRGEVLNKIAAAIVERIVKAHRSGSVFRVYVLLPLLPAFEGQVGTPSGTAMQYILHYTYSTLYRGESSLLKCLERQGIRDWQRYLCFCSLRGHDSLDGKLVTELVYIHSKLLIADDTLVIAGSANINDRSLLGDRDSEVALLIEDEQFEPGVMNGKPFDRGLFAGSLRRYLFSEHLGLIADQNRHIDSDAVDNCNERLVDDVFFQPISPVFAEKHGNECNYSTEYSRKKTDTQSKPKLSVTKIVDPVCDDFFNGIWRATAQNNTKLYEEVFSCYPSDSATSFEAVAELRKVEPLAAKDPDRAKVMLSDVRGHLVNFPIHFLENEIIKPTKVTKESLLPTGTWT